jgi:ubiquinone/menaquinone biosynthesis C-methylase UbiE
MNPAFEGFSPVPLESVRDYWNRRPCNIRHSPKQLGTFEYFEDVRQRKYFVEPHIPEFAEFGRWGGRRVLEIGCGIGTDTISFAQAGASVVAIDLSERSLEIARQRAAIYGVTDRVRFIQANAERLSEALSPEPFDLIYSFGVIHHTPHPERAVAEMRKYTVPGTTLKIMVYNRYSWKVLAIVAGSGKGRFWKLDQLVSNLSEAQTGCPVTYSYSRRGARQLLEQYGFNVLQCRIEHIFPYRVEEYTKYSYVRQWQFRVMPPRLFRWFERRLGWHLCLTARA